MSADQTRSAEETRTASDATTDDALDRDALEARVELLEAETDRLRGLYARTKRTAYRRTAQGLAAVGGIAVLAGVLFPAAQDVLFILAAIGLFGGLLTYYLTPERFIAADVTERVYTSLAANHADLAADLGLSDDHVYLPDDTTATLFIPQHAEDPLPDPATIEGPLVITESTRGLALEPSGARLFAEFERTRTGPLADEPARIASQVSAALVDAFELVDGTDIDVDATAGRLTLACQESTYPDRFDTPVASILSTALAVGLDQPIRTTTSADADLRVTCQWETTPDESGTEDDLDDEESAAEPEQ